MNFSFLPCRGNALGTRTNERLHNTVIVLIKRLDMLDPVTIHDIARKEIRIKFNCR
jgi:hypothetical protein